MTGVGSGKAQQLDLKQATKIVNEENERVAKLLGINKAARTTTVKPSGTSSLALGTSSGIHAWHNDFYIRRIRVGKNEPIYTYLAINHPELIEDEYFRPHDTAVISVPQKAPAGSILRPESALDIRGNFCFLYHLRGNGTGEWKVPVGGMGALVKELIRVATESGVEIKVNSKVIAVVSDDLGVTVETLSGDKYESDYLLSNAAPQVLAKLRGKPQPQSLDGSQMKINILLKRLPRLKSGIDPRLAFAGTFHANESFSQLEQAFQDAQAEVMPAYMPIEMYCHTLSDPSILGRDLQEAGYHTLTLFGLHTPASLFDADNDAAREVALASALSSVNEYLAEPIQDVIAAIEVKTPLDIEEAIALPRGNIFHKDLSMPFREDLTHPSWGL